MVDLAFGGCDLVVDIGAGDRHNLRHLSVRQNGRAEQNTDRRLRRIPSHPLGRRRLRYHIHVRTGIRR